MLLLNNKYLIIYKVNLNLFVHFTTDAQVNLKAAQKPGLLCKCCSKNMYYESQKQ
jgi:hypothetical protein